MKNDRNDYILTKSLFAILLFLTSGCSTNHAVKNEKGEGGSERMNWQITFSPHSTLSDVALENLDGGTLWIISGGFSRPVSVDSIAELRFVRHSRLWERVTTGAKIGTVVGAVLGALLVNPTASGETPYSRAEIQFIGRFLAAFIFGLEGGILGGLIGAITDFISAQDEVLELSHVPTAQKPNLIRDFLSKQASSNLDREP
jgi:gas vesicle protein